MSDTGSSFGRAVEAGLPDVIGQVIGQAIGGAVADGGREVHEIAALAKGRVPIAIPTIDLEPVELSGQTTESAGQAIERLLEASSGFGGSGASIAGANGASLAEGYGDLPFVDGGNAPSLDHFHHRLQEVQTYAAQHDPNFEAAGWDVVISAFQADFDRLDLIRRTAEFTFGSGPGSLSGLQRDLFSRPGNVVASQSFGHPVATSYDPGFLGINYVQQAGFERRVAAIHLRDEAYTNFRSADLSLGGLGRIGIGALQWGGGYVEFLSSPLTGALDASQGGGFGTAADRSDTDFILLAAGARSAIANSARASARAVTLSDEFIGPTIGRSGFRTSSEFAEAVGARYQGYADEAYVVGLRRQADGLLQGNANTRLGDFVDRRSATRLHAYLRGEGIAEGPNGLVQMNRWLRDPSGSGKYVRPDVRVPAAGRIFDATVGTKSYNSTQISGFRDYSDGDFITIVRPEQLGSYSFRP